jgi:RNA polymerase sigma-70 factor (ECF subfamily)
VSLRDILDHLPFPAEVTQEWAGAAAAHGGVSVVGGVPGMTAAAPGTAAPAAEIDLVRRAAAGDQDAFAVLVRLHQRQIYALALRMLHDSEEAVEATQDVFLAAWQNLGGFRGDSQLATWLYRIAYNHCLKIAERRRREAQTRAELASASARAERPAARFSQMQAQAALRDLCDLVRAEIDNLPPKYRAVLALRHLQDLSYEEIAEVLRVPIGTVKTHLFRARALLKERLAELDHAASSGLNRAGELSTGLRGLIGRRLEGLRKESDR